MSESTNFLDLFENDINLKGLFDIISPENNLVLADDQNALYFVLIVHTVQTMLVILLGIYAWVALSFHSVNNKIYNNQIN